MGIGSEAAAVIHTIETCIEITQAIIDVGRVKGLSPKALELIDRLPDIEILLESVKTPYEAETVTESASKMAQPVFQRCEQALGDLKALFTAICPKNGDGLGQRVWKRANSALSGKEQQAEQLVGAIETDLQAWRQRHGTFADRTSLRIALGQRARRHAF